MWYDQLAYAWRITGVNMHTIFDLIFRVHIHTSNMPPPHQILVFMTLVVGDCRHTEQLKSLTLARPQELGYPVCDLDRQLLPSAPILCHPHLETRLHSTAMDCRGPASQHRS